MSIASAAVTGVGQRIWSENLGAELAVCSASWSRATQAKYGSDAICAHEIEADTFTATMDGIGLKDGWHSGPESGQAVYFEKWAGGEPVSHGWLDSASRQIVQAG